MIGQLKYHIPRRESKCFKKQEHFSEGTEIVSVLLPLQEGYERRDYCPICYQEDQQQLSQKIGVIHWKTIILSKSSKKNYTRDEKALDLLREWVFSINENSTGSDQLIYVLALYLERRKQLVKRHEKRSDSEIIYEQVETGEVFPITRVNLSQVELEHVQGQLLAYLG